MKNDSSLPSKNNKPEYELDIQEVDSISKDINGIAGEVQGWQSLEIEAWAITEIKEKARMRFFLVYSTMSLWILWTIVALITQNPYLIVTSPPMLVLLVVVYRYYFK